TSAVRIADAPATGPEAPVVLAYSSGRAAVDVLMSPRGLSDSSVIVADTLARREHGVASRSDVRTAIPGCDLSVTVPTSINGRLSGAQLCELPQAGHSTQPQAAVA